MPDLPSSDRLHSKSGYLPYKGHSNLAQAINYFKAKEREGSRVLSGYAMAVDDIKKDQIQVDKVARVFSEMKNKDRAYIFTAYNSVKLHKSQVEKTKEVNLYLIPVCGQTMSFCEQMGCLPPIDSDHAMKANLFVYFMNVTAHPIYSHAEKCILTRSNFPSLNPKPIEVSIIQPYAAG